VLKPGGRIAVSDMVANRVLSDEQRRDKEKWCGCTSGALGIRDYIEELGKAGFTEIRFEPNIDMILKAIDSGQVRTEQDLSKEELKKKILADLRNWENIKTTMIVPYKITAVKPA